MTQPSIRGTVSTVVTHLEMLAPPVSPPLQPPVDGLEIVRALKPTVSFYRFLYDNVGKDWNWTGRRLLDDEELSALISPETIDLRVIWRHGVPAGYVELGPNDEGTTELIYFGLMPEFIGLGLGRYFIDWAVRHAFHKGARRLYVHTCDLDHPRALANYEAAGFVPFDREDVDELVIEGMPLPAHAANRAIVAT